MITLARFLFLRTFCHNKVWIERFYFEEKLMRRGLNYQKMSTPLLLGGGGHTFTRNFNFAYQYHTSIKTHVESIIMMTYCGDKKK